MLWSYNCQSPTHSTVWVYCNWWSKANYHSALHCAGKIANEGMLYCKISLKRPQTRTAVKVSKQQPPQPCAFDTQLRARTVPGLFGKAGLDGKPPPFWEATMAWTWLRPCSSENFSSYLLSNSLRYQGPNAWNSVKKSADDTRFTQPGSQNAILERNAQIIINF